MQANQGLLSIPLVILSSVDWSGARENGRLFGIWDLEFNDNNHDNDSSNAVEPSAVRANPILMYIGTKSQIYDPAGGRLLLFNVQNKHRRDPMRLIRITTFALCACGLLGSCSSREEARDPRTQLAEHKARRLANWRNLREKNFADRILPAPDFLLDYLRLDNNFSGRVGIPRAPRDWRSFARDVQAVIAEFPSPVRRHLQDHTVGIFLVTDLGTTGFSEILADFPEHHAGFIVLDVGTLDVPANAWATWRETTAFELSPEIKFSVRIAGERKNHRKQAISLILLHELGHLVGAANGAHCLWWSGGKPSKYPFSALSWIETDRGVASRWDDDFKDRHSVQFYAPGYWRTPAGSAQRIYTQLLKTDFVSLYASTNEYEDFAETYAMYVHVVMQGQPWTFELQCDGTTRVEFAERILQDRCKEKRQYIAALMKGKSQQ